MSVEAVPIQANEIPAVPQWTGANLPSPILNPYDSAYGEWILPSGTFFTPPDGGASGWPNPSSCTRWTTVQADFYGWDGSDTVRPLSFATAWVWDVDYDIQANTPFLSRFYGAYLLNSVGHLNTGSICNQDASSEPSSGTADIAIAVLPVSSAARVIRYYSTAIWDLDAFVPKLYTAWTPQLNNVPDGSANLGNWFVPQNTNVRLAFAIYSLWSGVLAGWDLVANRVTPSYIPQAIELHYPRPLYSGGDVPNKEPFSHYHVMGAKCGWTRPDDPYDILDRPNVNDCPYWHNFHMQIHIDSAAAAKNLFVINHLYAHYVMQRFYNGAYPSNGATEGTSSRFAGDFDENANCAGTTPSYQLYCNARFAANYSGYDSTHGKEIAWAEGFADAFALRAMASRPGGLETSIFSFQSATGTAWTYDFEPWRGSNAESKEQTTASALRDLDDASVDGLDSYAGGFDRIWKAFTFTYASTMRGFWDNWRAALHPEVFGAREALAQNDLVTSRSTLNTPPASDAWSDYVHICWTTANPTDLSKIEVHKSTTANFVPTTATLWTTITDTRTCQDVTGLSLGVAYYFELITYSRSGFPANSNQVSATTHLPATVEGYVKNTGGSPISGTGVVVTFPSGSTYTATTNSNGYYTFTTNFLGTHRLKVAATGYTSHCKAKAVSVYGTLYRFDFTLSTGTASIAPIYASPAVYRASVTVRDCYGAQVWSGLTDTAGRAAGISGLTHGTFTVTASWTDWSECTGDPGQYKRIWTGDVVLEIPPNQSPTVAMAIIGRSPCPV